MVGKAPLGKERACSTVKMVPHAQCDSVRGSCQPYRRASASQKALLWRENPNSSIGSEVSQLEAPFSPASSIARDYVYVYVYVYVYAYAMRHGIVLSAIDFRP